LENEENQIEISVNSVQQIEEQTKNPYYKLKNKNKYDINTIIKLKITFKNLGSDYKTN